MNIFRFILPGFKENWKAVLLSVLGATTFWFFNAMTKKYDASLDYPLVFSFAKDSVVVMQPLANSVKIEVSSGGWNLIRRTIRVNASPVEIQLDNPTEIKFLTRSSLRPVITSQLSGLDVTQVITDTLFIDIEKKVVKRLAVVVDSLSIPLSQSHRLVSPIQYDVDTVVIAGPESVVSELGKVIHVKFSDEDITGVFNEKLGFILPGGLSISPKITKVQFQVSKFLAREVNIPLELLNFPQDSSVLLDKRDITIYYTVKEDKEDDVTSSDFSVTADYKMRNQRDSTVTPILMYAHESALDIVLDVDWIKLNYTEKE